MDEMIKLCPKCKWEIAVCNRCGISYSFTDIFLKQDGTCDHCAWPLDCSKCNIGITDNGRSVQKWLHHSDTEPVITPLLSRGVLDSKTALLAVLSRTSAREILRVPGAHEVLARGLKSKVSALTMVQD